MNNRFDLILARNKELLGAVAAIGLGMGAGFLGVAVVDACMGRDDRMKTMWDAGTSALVAGCLATSAAARGSRAYRRMWR